MIIRSAQFVTSAAAAGQWPDHQGPEVAFAGRSNVGKSSLINKLVNRKALVKTSARPGKTQLINFFSINDRFMLVDLPGFGYAKVPQRIRAGWQTMVEDYLSTRRQLAGVVVLMDVRRDPRSEEHQLLHYLEACRRPWLVALTKADKLSRSKATRRMQDIAAAWSLAAENLVLTSAKTGAGIDRLWQRLGQWLQPFHSPPAAGSTGA